MESTAEHRRRRHSLSDRHHSFLGHESKSYESGERIAIGLVAFSRMEVAETTEICLNLIESRASAALISSVLKGLQA